VSGEVELFRVTSTGLQVTPSAPLRDDGSPDWGEVPDWVMVGLPDPVGSVRLFASRTLIRAGLQRVANGWVSVPITPNPNGPKARILNESRIIVAEMRDFTNLSAASYPDALRTLVDLWGRGGDPGAWTTV
jgi:hypothetical protein